MRTWNFVENVENHRELLTEPYMELDGDWVPYVNILLKEGELHNIRNSVNRQAPLGQEQWQLETAANMVCYQHLEAEEDPVKICKSSPVSLISCIM